MKALRILRVLALVLVLPTACADPAVVATGGADATAVADAAADTTADAVAETAADTLADTAADTGPPPTPSSFPNVPPSPTAQRPPACNAVRLKLNVSFSACCREKFQQRVRRCRGHPAPEAALWAKSAKPGLRRTLISLYHGEIIHVVPAPRRRGFVDVARGFEPQGERYDSGWSSQIFVRQHEFLNRSALPAQAGAATCRFAIHCDGVSRRGIAHGGGQFPQTLVSAGIEGDLLDRDGRPGCVWGLGFLSVTNSCSLARTTSQSPKASCSAWSVCPMAALSPWA